MANYSKDCKSARTTINLYNDYILWMKLYNIPMQIRSSYWSCFVKKGVLEISQNSQENTFVRVTFLIKLQAWDLQLYKKSDSGTGVFLWILRNFWAHPFYRTPPDDCFLQLDFEIVESSFRSTQYYVLVFKPFQPLFVTTTLERDCQNIPERLLLHRRLGRRITIQEERVFRLKQNIEIL